MDFPSIRSPTTPFYTLKLKDILIWAETHIKLTLKWPYWDRPSKVSWDQKNKTKKTPKHIYVYRLFTYLTWKFQISAGLLGENHWGGAFDAFVTSVMVPLITCMPLHYSIADLNSVRCHNCCFQTDLYPNWWTAPGLQIRITDQLLWHVVSWNVSRESFVV